MAWVTTTPKVASARSIEDTPDLERYVLLAGRNNKSSSSGPSKSLYCPICSDLFKKPMRAPCGHSFCSRCISRWLAMNRTCPADRKPLTAKQLHHDFIIEGLVAELDAVCPFKKLGCRVGVLPLQLMRPHAAECQFNYDNLPDFIKQVLPDQEEEEGDENVVIGSSSPNVVVISDDENDENAVASVPTSNRSGVVLSPEIQAPFASSSSMPLRLRLLRTGTARAEDLRDVVGSSSSTDN